MVCGQGVLVPPSHAVRPKSRALRRQSHDIVGGLSVGVGVGTGEVNPSSGSVRKVMYRILYLCSSIWVHGSIDMGYSRGIDGGKWWG